VREKTSIKEEFKSWLLPKSSGGSLFLKTLVKSYYSYCLQGKLVPQVQLYLIWRIMEIWRNAYNYHIGKVATRSFYFNNNTLLQ